MHASLSLSKTFLSLAQKNVFLEYLLHSEHLLPLPPCVDALLRPFKDPVLPLKIIDDLTRTNLLVYYRHTASDSDAPYTCLYVSNKPS